MEHAQHVPVDLQQQQQEEVQLNAPQQQEPVAPFPVAPVVHQVRPRNLNLPLPSFGGGYVPGVGYPTQAVENYCIDVRHHLRVCATDLDDQGITTPMFVAMLGAQLTGTAKDFYRQLIKEQDGMQELHPAFATIDGWLSAIRAQFTDPNVEEFTRRRLLNLAMGKTPGALRSYNQEINGCLALLGRLPAPNASLERQNKFDYLDGLSKRMKHEACRLPDYQTLTLPQLQSRLELIEMNVFNFTAFAAPSSSERAYDPMEIDSTRMVPGGRGGRGGRGSNFSFTGGRGGRGGERARSGERQHRGSDHRGRSGERQYRQERWPSSERRRNRSKGRSPSRGREFKPDDPVARAFRTRCREENLCFGCGEPDHRIADCPTRVGKGQGAQR